MIKAISPLDGRYHDKLEILQDYFSEYALIKYRLHVEIEYFIHLIETLPNTSALNDKQKASLRNLHSQFNAEEAKKIKDIEKTTNHDVKAVEYYLKTQLSELNLDKLKEYIHFGLTSQDINNTATPLLLRDFTLQNLLPRLSSVLDAINQMGITWKSIPMLARTHGQPASPTTLGKEFLVFSERLNNQLISFQNISYSAKFGGATGNFNAHHVAYPQIDWSEWSNGFLQQSFHLKRQQYTTQIAHYDEIAEWCHQLVRINTILLDFCKDIWTYVSMDYFKQKTKAGEVGSSAMPHKVNPIDFENAEGNLGISSALASHLAEKLPISRLQRDLTDSTVLRNLGVPIGHSYLALLSIQSGLSKLELNETKIKSDLDDQWIILSEAVQTILRREGFENPYELMRDLTRGKTKITQSDLHEFIDTLKISDSIKAELKALRPEGYVGVVK
jgi:adenylosuccinate lyase